MEKLERNQLRLAIGNLENAVRQATLVIDVLKDVLNDGTGNDEGVDAVFTPSERSADSALGVDMEAGDGQQVDKNEYIGDIAQPLPIEGEVADRPERVFAAESEEAPKKRDTFPFRRRRQF